MTSIIVLWKKIDPELLFIDTDSLTYKIKSEDLYEEFLKQEYLFYLSNFPKYLEFFDPANEKLLAKWKIYTKENRDKFSGLKSKMRCILSDDGKESNTAKGVKIGIELFEYKDILFNKEIIRHKMKRIQSKKHETRTYWVHKISLSCFGDKRYTLDYGVHTLAYFHKDLKK